MSPIAEAIWRFIFTIVFKWFYGVKFLHKERAPKTGRYIVAPNHASNFDPPIAGLAMPRPTYYMAKAELFKNPILRFIIKSLGAFPVKRGRVDNAAIKKAIDILEHDELLGMFPQGTRRKEGSFDRLHDGVPKLALITGSPIIPMALVGTGKMQRNKIAVVIGEPIIVKKEKVTKERINEIKIILSEKLAQLYAEGKRAIESKEDK